MKRCKKITIPLLAFLFIFCIQFDTFALTNTDKISTLYTAKDSDVDFGITGDPGTKTDASFSETVSYYFEDTHVNYTMTSFYKKTGNNWFHYKNMIQYHNYNASIAVYFYKDNSKCSTKISQYSCTNSRISILEFIDKKGSIGYYKVIHKYLNMDTEHPSLMYAYDKKGRIEVEIKQKINNKGNVTSSSEKQFEYYENGKIKSVSISNYNGEAENNMPVSSSEKTYDKKGRLIFKYNDDGKYYWTEERTYHKNNKLKEKKIVKRINSLQTVASYSYGYRANGTNQYHKKVLFKKDIPYQMNYYTYNKKGQLKSNKYGNAYKYIVKIEDYLFGDVKKAKYNANGKLGKYKKVKPTKATSTF